MMSFTAENFHQTWLITAMNKHCTGSMSNNFETKRRMFSRHCCRPNALQVIKNLYRTQLTKNRYTKLIYDEQLKWGESIQADRRIFNNAELRHGQMSYHPNNGHNSQMFSIDSNKDCEKPFCKLKTFRNW